MSRLGHWSFLISLSIVASPVSMRASSLVHVRLLTPLSSLRMPSGSEVRSVVIAPYEQAGRVLLPPGTLLFGSVRKSVSVGMGFVHERARIEIEFTGYALPDGRMFPFQGTLRCIDNARETVTSSGAVKGILAASTPQGYLGGVWHRPSVELFQRSFVGLTGVPGRIWKGYALGPIGGVALFVVRCAIFSLPDPEIRLAPGTEMRIAVTRLDADAPAFDPPSVQEAPADFTEWLHGYPIGIEKPNGHVAADIINLAFAGSRLEIVQGFQAAGWSEAAPRSAKSITQLYRAYSNQTGYREAPTSTLLYRSAEPDLIFQKSLNTIAKRHHIRIWRQQVRGREIWLAAATHDIGIGFDAKAVAFKHKINTRVDSERSKIVNDLVFSGCVEPPQYVNRPSAVRARGGDGGIVTDGRLALLSFRSCTKDDELSRAEVPSIRVPPGFAIVRRMILEGKQYVLRDNAYYWTYRAAHWRKREPPNVMEEME